MTADDPRDARWKGDGLPRLAAARFAAFLRERGYRPAGGEATKD